MADFWQIQGEAGATLDETVRSFAALGYRGARVEFPSFGVDLLSFSIPLADVASISEIVPDNNQAVTVWRDGVKFFTGKAKVAAEDREISVNVYGPGWDAEAIPMTQLFAEQLGAPATQERAMIVLPAASLSDMLETLVNRAAALGVPWQLGTVPATWNSGKITLQQMGCMEAIAEIARMVSDLAMWIDYTTTPPTVNFSRRLTGLGAGTATTRTIDSSEASKIAVNPILQLQVSKVRIPYTTRTAAGARLYAEQSAGSGSRVQFAPWSGPELDSFVLPEGTDSYAVQTTPANVSLGSIKPWILKLIPEVVASRAAFVNRPTDAQVILTNGEIRTFYNQSNYGVSGSINLGTRTYQTKALLYIDEATGLPTSVVGKHLVITPNPPDWLVDASGFQKVKITGQLMVDQAEILYTAPTYSAGSDAPDPPAWHAAFPFNGSWEAFGYAAYSGGAVNVDRALYDLRWLTFELDAYLSTTAYTTGTTLRKPAEFDWSEPPAGFAAGLLASQSWVPYEGRVEITEAEAGATRYRGCVVNVTNYLPDHATMKAMVQTEEINIDSGTTTIRLGAPERLSFQQVIQKFRRASADNITVQ